MGTVAGESSDGGEPMIEDLMDEFFETNSYDETVDWENVPESTEEDDE